MLSRRELFRVGAATIAWTVIGTPQRLLAGEPLSSVLEQYERLYRKIERNEDNVAWELIDYLSPKSPGIDLTDSPGDNPVATLRAFLNRHEAVVADAIALATRPMEPIPESPPLNDEDPDAHMRHPKAWVVNVARLVSADAHRAWDYGDFEGAADRIIAVWHIGASGVRNNGQRVTIVLAMNLTFSGALLDAGLAEKVSVATIERWLKAIRRIDRVDPYGYLETWRFEVEQAVVTLKQEFGGPDAGERLAEYFETWGIIESGIDDLNHSQPDLKGINELLRLTAPFKSKAALARSLTAAQIAERIEAAALLIPDLDQAVRSDDPTKAMRPVLETVASDPTHIARRLFGGIGMAVPLTISTRETIAKIVKRLEQRVP